MIDVDVYVRGAAGAITRSIEGVGGDASAWSDADVRGLLGRRRV